MGRVSENHYKKLSERFSSKKEGFVEKCLKVHGDLYDYSLVKYVNNKTKVEIICKKHGVFEQRPDNHTNLKHICPKCKIENQSIRQTKKWVDTLAEFNIVHNNKYDYSKVDYINMSTDIIIICPFHGDFEQKPSNHLSGKSCQECYNDRRKKLSTELHKLYRRIKSLIYNSYKNKNFSKTSRSFEILGCSWQEFKEYLENNPYDFKIEDEGLDLDHVVPISSAKTEEDIIKLNHYTNFQLLPYEYNRNIKKDKHFNREHFEEYLKK
jgi:hypothetical protein